MVATATASAIAALKTTPAPKFIRVKERDSEAMAQIAVPEVKRWKARISKILDALPWAWIEPLDTKGNIAGPRIENAGPVAGEIEDLELPESSAKSSAEIAALSGMLSLMLKAQDVALQRQSQAYGVVLDNNQSLLKTISDRLAAMEKHAAQNFEVITSLHNRLNMEIHREGEGGDSMDSLVAEVVGAVAKSKLGIGDE